MGLKVCQLCAVDFTLKHFLLPLIDGMQDAGWEVTSVCSDGPAVSELRARGYEIETIDIARNFNLLRHVLSTWALIKFFRKRQFDVLHVHTPIAALIGRVAAKCVGIPTVVYTAHGFYFHDEMPRSKRRIFVLLERIGGYLTDLLFTQSAEDAETAVHEGIVPAERVLAIGNGVDVGRFDPSLLGNGRSQRLALGIPEGAFVIGIIARLVQEKGVSEFLAAAIEAARARNDLYFLMVGERLASDHAGNISNDLERASVRLGGRLICTGARTDIPELLSAMDVFCLPSWREGMPRTIIEAMMMAKPVIATNIRGSREEVLDEETGFLVPTRNAKALAEAMLRYVREPGRAQSMGAAGRARALSLYDERRVVALQVESIGKHLQGTGDSKPRICIALTSPFAYSAFLKPHVERLVGDYSVTICVNTAESSIPVSVPSGARLVSMPIVRDINPLRDLIALLKMWRFFRRERFDLVFSMTPKGGMVAMIAARVAGVPRRVHCFTGQVWATRRGVARIALQSIDRLLVFCATHLLADSHSQRDFLIEEGVVASEKIRVLGNGSICGVDVSVFRPDAVARTQVRRSFGILDDDVCLLFVGRLTVEKGVADLVAAFRRLSSRYKNLHLLLVGPDEASMAMQWHGMPKLHLVGYTQSVHQFMAAGDILCLPSYREGFGSVLIEAGAVGLPVVASRIYGVTDAVVDGETGLLHEPRDISDLAEKLEQLVASPALRARIGEQACLRATDDFGQTGVVEAFCEFFCEIHSKRYIEKGSVK